MMKRLFFILIMLFISINIGFSTTVYASNAIKITDDDTLNNLDGDGKYLGNNYRDNYYLDIEKTDVFEAGDYMLNQIANALFSIVKILGFAASVFFYRVMVFDVSEVFATEINAIQSALKLSIFDSFFILAFAASAWNLMKRLTKRDLSGLVVEIGKILCIFLLSSFVVTHSATALSATTSITKDISVSALMNINQQGNVSVESYAANASGMIWKSLVHAPWKSLEFEGGSDDESHVEAFLSEPPGTAERKDLVEDYRETYSNAMSKSKGVGRIGFLIVYLIPFLVKSGIYMFIAILQLVFQVMAVFYILLAPVILLLSLVPAFGGIELVSSWLKKILETQIMMLIISNFVKNQVMAKPEKRLLVIDEGWILLQHEESARFVAGLVRRARKYYLGISIISQQANDFLKNEYGRAIASQSALRILMRQDTTTIKGIVSEFNLSEYEQSFLLTCERGDALLIADQNHVAVKVVAAEEEHPLITTNPAELYNP